VNVLLLNLALDQAKPLLPRRAEAAWAPGKARPAPDALLAEAEKEGRGRLKIFLGAAPGVGKTYSMLEAAREKIARGLDVVVA